MECRGVGVGLNVNQETGEVLLFLSLHEEEEGDPAAAFVMLPLDKAMVICMSLSTRLVEARNLVVEIESTPPEERHKIFDRLLSGLN